MDWNASTEIFTSETAGRWDMNIISDLRIKHLTRVEGHGNIDVRIVNGKVEQARWEVVEAPRFFEAMLVGKMWERAPWLCGRICGICSIGHTLTSIRAIERAFGFVPSNQTRLLRLLIKHMETLQSHILHIFFLVAPDYLDLHSVLPLCSTRSEIVQLAARLKKLANDGVDLLGGRRLHPTRVVTGGFTVLPDMDGLVDLHRRLELARSDLESAAAIFGTFTIPSFERETEYVSLQGDSDYPFIGGNLISSDGIQKDEHEYLLMTNEYHVEQSTSRWSKLSRKSFAVGALARMNNNGMLLHAAAQKMAKRFGLHPQCHNPYYLPLAQLVECVHVVEDSLLLLDTLLGGNWQTPRQKVQPCAGVGVGAVEVPRGILYHMYEFDGQGRIIRADCVIPTSQNHANIQHDLEKLARESANAGMPERKIARLAEMLVRAYDPCISCSVH